MVSWSALANTSAGAPLAVFCSSTPEAAKLNCTLVPGLAASNSGAMSLNALVRLAAAETVTSAACEAKDRPAARARVRVRIRRVFTGVSLFDGEGGDIEVFKFI